MIRSFLAAHASSYYRLLNLLQHLHSAYFGLLASLDRPQFASFRCCRRFRNLAPRRLVAYVLLFYSVLRHHQILFRNSFLIAPFQSGGAIRGSCLTTHSFASQARRHEMMVATFISCRRLVRSSQDSSIHSGCMVSPLVLLILVVPLVSFLDSRTTKNESSESRRSFAPQGLRPFIPSE